LTAAPAQIGGTGLAGTLTMGIRPDILVDASATGNGTSFATYVGTNSAVAAASTGGPGFRALNAATEMTTAISLAATNNVGLVSASMGGSIAGAVTTTRSVICRASASPIACCSPTWAGNARIIRNLGLAWWAADGSNTDCGAGFGEGTWLIAVE
jgi:hypothetical protein